MFMPIPDSELQGEEYGRIRFTGTVMFLASKEREIMDIIADHLAALRKELSAHDASARFVADEQE